MAKYKKGGNKIGSWAFLIGVILAVLFGIITAIGGGIGPGMVYVLVVLGIVIGLLNIADEETSSFLLSGTALVIVSALGQNVTSGVPVFDGILNVLIMLFVPATVIIALKNVFALAKN